MERPLRVTAILPHVNRKEREMQRLKSLILLAIFALPICTSEATYRIDITPKTDNAIFETELNTSVTFNVTGYEKKADAATEAQVKIDKLWWNFDKEILSKVNSGPSAITLKAVKSGASKLTAIAMIKNHNCTKTVTLLIKDTAQSKKIPAAPLKAK